MRGIDEPVRFAGRDGGRNDQNACPAFVNKAIADPGQGCWSRSGTPIGRQLLRCYEDAGDAVGNFGPDQHKIVRNVIRIQMGKIFDHRKRKMLGRIGDSGTRAGPSSAESESALAIERIS